MTPGISGSNPEPALCYDMASHALTGTAMALANFFKSIFGGAGGNEQPQPTPPQEYAGYAIEAAPINEDGKYRTAGFISGEIDGEPKRIQFIRADQNSDLQAAIEHSMLKARQIIDEQGPDLLNKSHL